MVEHRISEVPSKLLVACPVLHRALGAPHMSAGVEWTTRPSVDLAGTSLKGAAPFSETVPTFVPTTKLDQVRRSVAVSLEGLAAQRFCDTPSQFVAFGLSRWFLVRPVLGRRGS